MQREANRDIEQSESEDETRIRKLSKPRVPKFSKRSKKLASDRQADTAPN